MLINSQPDMEVVGEAADVPDTVRKAVAIRPDVALVDITMPGGSAIEVTRVRFWPRADPGMSSRKSRVRSSCPRSALSTGAALAGTSADLVRFSPDILEEPRDIPDIATQATSVFYLVSIDTSSDLERLMKATTTPPSPTNRDVVPAVHGS